MRTVRFNVQITTADIESFVGLRMKTNAHDMVIHGTLYEPRTLLFRSHSLVSSVGGVSVVEVVLQRLDDTFPENKRARLAVADLHLLLQDMTVPNVEMPTADEGQAEVVEEEVAEEQPPSPELLGADLEETSGTTDARFGDEDEAEGDDDGPECDGAVDRDQRKDHSDDGEGGGSYQYPRRDGD